MLIYIWDYFSFEIEIFQFFNDHILYIFWESCLSRLLIGFFSKANKQFLSFADPEKILEGLVRRREGSWLQRSRSPREIERKSRAHVFEYREVEDEIQRHNSRRVQRKSDSLRLRNRTTLVKNYFTLNCNCQKFIDIFF